MAKQKSKDIPVSRKPAPKTDKVETKPRAKLDTEAKWVSTGKYNPKAAHTVKTWEELEAQMPMSIDEMRKVDHKNPGFPGYLVRRGAIELLDE